MRVRGGEGRFGGEGAYTVGLGVKGLGFGIGGSETGGWNAGVTV
jgi:hypothetical protein